MRLHRLVSAAACLALLSAVPFAAGGCSYFYKKDTYQDSPPHMPKPSGPKIAVQPAGAAAPLPVPQGSLPPLPDSQRDKGGGSVYARSCGYKIRAKQYQEAATKCLTALKADPYNVQATAELAECYAALSKKEWAIYMLKRLKALKPMAPAEVTAKLAATENDPNWAKYLQDDGYQAAVAAQ